jgi:hypothetical protein
LLYKETSVCADVLHIIDAGFTCLLQRPTLTAVVSALALEGTKLWLFRLSSARCILSGLKSIHAAGFGHGGLRWPNVIVTGRDQFVLIDLEGAVKLGTVFDTASVDSLPTAWRAGEVLWNGQYTVQSDLQQVADMIRATGVSMDDLVLSLTTALTADEVLQRLH